PPRPKRRRYQTPPSCSLMAFRHGLAPHCLALRVLSCPSFQTDTLSPPWRSPCPSPLQRPFTGARQKPKRNCLPPPHPPPPSTSYRCSHKPFPTSVNTPAGSKPSTTLRSGHRFRARSNGCISTMGHWSKPERYSSRLILDRTGPPWLVHRPTWRRPRRVWPTRPAN